VKSGTITIIIKITTYTVARVHPIRSRNAYRVQSNTHSPARSQKKGPAISYMRLLYEITRYFMKQLISQRRLATFRYNLSGPILFLLSYFILEYANGRLCRNVGNRLPIYAA